MKVQNLHETRNVLLQLLGLPLKLMTTEGFLNLRLFKNVLELETPTTYLALKKN